MSLSYNICISRGGSHGPGAPERDPITITVTVTITITITVTITITITVTITITSTIIMLSYCIVYHMIL